MIDRTPENNHETRRNNESGCLSNWKDGPMPRIDLLDETTSPILARQYFGSGDPGPIVAALANVPELLAPTIAFVGAALGGGASSNRHKEFAILRTSALLGCQYCINSHTAVAVDAGLSAAEVRALRGEVPVEEAFTDVAERALLRWIDAMAGASGAVPDDIWAAARSWWPDHVLVELSVTIGATMFLNRFATGFELPTSPSVLARLDAEGLR